MVTTIDCLAFTALLYTLFAFRDHRRRRGFPYPPEPLSWPVIGNLLDVPKLSPGQPTRMTKNMVGPITPGVVSLNLGLRLSGGVVFLQDFDQTVVVLSSLAAIKDLFERRGM